MRGMTDLADRHHGDEGAMIDGTKPLLAKLLEKPFSFPSFFPEILTVSLALLFAKFLALV